MVILGPFPYFCLNSCGAQFGVGDFVCFHIFGIRVFLRSVTDLQGRKVSWEHSSFMFVIYEMRMVQ